jgi:hypothetical protein
MRIDKAVSERVEISKGTLWAIGIAPVFLMLVLNYGSSIIGWTRDDQSQRIAVQQLENNQKEMRDDMKSLNSKFDDLGKTLQAQAVADAKKAGYELGAVDGTTGHANVKK